MLLTLNKDGQRSESRARREIRKCYIKIEVKNGDKDKKIVKKIIK